MAVAEHEITGAGEAVPVPWRCPRELFYRMGDAGLFEGQRVILVDGEILAMPPIGPAHQSTNDFAADVFKAAFGDGFYVRGQGPFDVGTATDPEPDIAVVRGSARDYVAAHPTQAVLIAEVSVATLAYDRGDKASLYASVGVEDYWIINPAGQQVEVHRRPVPDAEKTFGAGYAEVVVYRPGETITPLGKAEARVAVADLLP